MFGKKLAVPTKTVTHLTCILIISIIVLLVYINIYIYNINIYIYIYILYRYKKTTSDPQLKDYRARTPPPAFLISCSGRFHVWSLGPMVPPECPQISRGLCPETMIIRGYMCVWIRCMYNLDSTICIVQSCISIVTQLEFSNRHNFKKNTCQNQMSHLSAANKGR